MPEFKERPKMGRPKIRPITILPKQATHILKEKYRQQLEQHPEGAENETAYAIGKIEEAGRQVADDIKTHTPRPHHRQRQNPLKQRETPTTPKDGVEVQTEKPRSKTRPANSPKNKAAQEQTASRQSSLHAPEQNVKAGVGTRTPMSTAPGQAGDPPPHANGLARPQEAGRQAFVSHQRSRPRERPSTSSGGGPTAKSPRSHLLKERPRTVFKSKAIVSGKKPGLSPKIKPTAKAAKAVKKAAQRRMRQQAIARAKRAVKIAARVGHKIAIAVAKAVASLIGNLVALLGGNVLLILLIFIVAIAAIASSPFGIFFSGGGGSGGGNVSTVSVSEAVSSINAAYNTRLKQLQGGDYDRITLEGQAADWPDVLAVFAARYAAADDGVDVATLDADRVSKLTDTFWDMTTITSWEETVSHPDGDLSGTTEYILHINISPKTAEEMKTAYSFTDFQASALDELLADPTALASLW